MSTIYSSTPTLTQTTVIPTGSIVTTFTDIVTTAPGSISTSYLSTCIALNASNPSAGCSNSYTTYYITQPGAVITNQVPLTIIYDDQITQVATFYGQACTVIDSPGPVSPGPVTPGPVTPGPVTPGPVTPGPVTPGPVVPGPATPSPAPPGPGTPPPRPVTSYVTVVTTPPPTIIRQPSTTWTSTPAPVTGTIAAAQATDSGISEKKKFPIAPVVGGVVGGLVVLAGLGYLAYHFFFKPHAAGGKFGGKPSNANRPSYGEDVIYQNVPQQPPIDFQHPQVQGEVAQQGAHGQNECGTTGGESQQQNSNPFQDAYQDYQDNKVDRLPQKLEQKLQEKLEEQFGQPSMSQIPGGPFTGGYPASGLVYGAAAGAAGAGAAGRHNPNYSPSSSPPLPPPGAYVPTHGSQPSMTSISSGPSALGQAAWIPPSPPGGQYNVAVPGQSGFPQQQQPQMAYNSHLASQYKGYAEPSRGMNS